METVITFTPSQLVTFIGSIAAVCAALATITGFIVAIVKRWKAPEVEQNKRIKVLEEENKSRKEEIEELKKRIGEGDDQFLELEKTNKVILRTLQALLNLSLGVSDTEALKKVSEDLNDFILNK